MKLENFIDRDREQATKCEAAFQRKWNLIPEPSFCDGRICVVHDLRRSVVEMYDITAWRVRSVGFLRAPQRRDSRSKPDRAETSEAGSVHESGGGEANRLTPVAHGLSCKCCQTQEEWR